MSSTPATSKATRHGVFDGSTDASMFAANYYYSSESNTVRTEDEPNTKGKDSLFCALRDMGGFHDDDFETNMRIFIPEFEIGSNYFDDVLWSSVCSPHAHQLVSSSCFGSTNVSSVNNQSPRTATLIDSLSSVSVPDQINTTPTSTNIKQETSWNNDGRNHHTLSSYEEAHSGSSSNREIDHFSLLIDAELFRPFDDDNIASEKQLFECYEELEAMIRPNRERQAAPTASSSSTTTMVPGDSVVTSSTCSGQDLVPADVVPCSKRKLSDPSSSSHGAAPDRLLEDNTTENTLEMHSPPPTTFEQPDEVLPTDISVQRYQFRGEFAGSSSSAPRCAGMELCSKEMMRSAESHEQPRSSTLTLDAVPVKDHGFQKFQNGMNQMDVTNKRRIRDALYRLEQRHHDASTSALVVGSSSSERFRSSVTEKRKKKVQIYRMDQNTGEPRGSAGSTAASAETDKLNTHRTV